MATLYAVSQNVNGRVCNTCNAAEDFVGYSTMYGDNAGDFALLQDLLTWEVRALGYELGLPENLIQKVPSDGLCGKTDEENLGVTYNDIECFMLGKYHLIAPENFTRIFQKHKANLFKYNVKIDHYICPKELHEELWMYERGNY